MSFCTGGKFKLSSLWVFKYKRLFLPRIWDLWDQDKREAAQAATRALGQLRLPHPEGCQTPREDEEPTATPQLVRENNCPQEGQTGASSQISVSCSSGCDPGADWALWGLWGEGSLIHHRQNAVPTLQRLLVIWKVSAFSSSSVNSVQEGAQAAAGRNECKLTSYLWLLNHSLPWSPRQHCLYLERLHVGKLLFPYRNEQWGRESPLISRTLTLTKRKNFPECVCVSEPQRNWIEWQQGSLKVKTFPQILWHFCILTSLFAGLENPATEIGRSKETNLNTHKRN